MLFRSQNERENIRRRQEEGIAAARARGVRFGRPARETPEDFVRLVAAWEQKKITVWEIVDQCCISEASFFRRLRELRLDGGVRR